jgi:hypothetical protein
MDVADAKTVVEKEALTDDTIFKYDYNTWTGETKELNDEQIDKFAEAMAEGAFADK